MAARGVRARLEDRDGSGAEVGEGGSRRETDDLHVDLITGLFWAN